MPVSLGKVGRFDAAGWSTLTPSNGTVTGLPGEGSDYTDDGTRLIYVSNSTGNDANKGTHTAPVKTFKKAMTLRRTGYPDWVLALEGDTWDDEKSAGLAYWAGFHGMSGRLATDGVTVEPAVFTSYNTTGVSLSTPRGTVRAARPLLRFYSTDSVNGDTILFSGPQNYFVVRGIHAYAYKNDIAGAGYDAAAISCGGISCNSQQPYLLVEDCRFQACSCGVDNGSVTIGGTVQFRRSAVDNVVAGIGLYLNHIKSVSLIESCFHKNGWNANGTRNTFSHNVYGQVTDPASDATPEAWLYQSNLVTYGSDTGLRMRQTGVVSGNVFSACENSLDYGGGGIGPGAVNGARSIEDNISLDCYDGSGDFAIVAATSTYGTITLRRNLAANHNAAAAGTVGNFSTPDNTGADLDASNVVYNAGTTYLNTGAGNSVVAPSAPSGGDLTRSLARYAVEVMGLGSSTDYAAAETQLIEAVLDNAEWNFDSRLHPNTIRNWIGDGFGMAAVNLAYHRVTLTVS